MWNKITGQEKVINQLGHFFKTRKIAHSYIFCGPDGVGKDAVAIEYSKLLNCRNPGEAGACDSCEECRKISGLRSEFFELICALPSGKSEQSDSDPVEKLSAGDFEAYMEQLDKKSENAYHHISLQNANNIRINSIRNLISNIYLTTSPNHIKAYLISEADKMTQEASNALLKVLEEPPRNSVIILTTSKLNSLPPTILGRCQIINFEHLSRLQVREKLSSSHSGHDPAEAELASRLCSGSYSRAVELLELGTSRIRELSLSFLVSILRDNYADIVNHCRTLGGKNSKDMVRFFLNFLNAWFRDLMLLKNLSNSGQAGTESGLVANFDLIERLKKFNSNYPETDFFRVIMSLEESEKLISQNVHMQLVLINLSFKLKRFLK